MIMMHGLPTEVDSFRVIAGRKQLTQLTSSVGV